MSPEEIYNKIVKLYPDGETELANWKTDWQFLFSVVLSAQTTDKQVNKVTAKLFQKYGSLEELSSAKEEDVQKIISGVNYNKSKSQYIVCASKLLIQNHGGKVPLNVDELIKLPGVGLKSANVFLSVFGDEGVGGIAVDTHVMRISHRLSLSDKAEPEKIAEDLEKIYDKKLWRSINGHFVLFGRYFCKARNPRCSECPFFDICRYEEKALH